MTVPLRFWYYFSIAGILLFITSVILTYTSFFTNSPELMTVSLVFTIIGVFMMYFGIWRGDKVAKPLRPVTVIGERNNDNK